MAETTEVTIILSEHIRTLILEKKNRSLIVNSVSSKKEFQFIYGFSVKHLTSRAKEIDEALELLNEEEIIILNDMLQGVINLCKDEWVGDYNPVEIINDDSLRKVCSLCGQKNNKWVFNIRNKINNNKMNVGSSCIGEFPSIELQKGKTRSMLEKEAMRKSLLQDLTLKFPGIEKVVVNWEKEVDRYEIMIPYEIEEPYQRIGIELKGIYDEYLIGSKDENIYKEIEEYLTKRKDFISAMEEYVKEHRESEYIVTNKIVKWLKEHGKNQTIETLKQTGYVTYDTASVIHEPDFLLKVADDMNFIFTDTEIEIIDLDFEMKGFVIKPLKKNDFNLICPFDRFIGNYTWVLFGENGHAKFSMQNIFKSTKIYDRKSVDIIVNDLIYRINDAHISLSLYESSLNDYYELNQLDIYDNNTKKVTVTNLMNFLQEFKIYAFGIKEVDMDDIRSYLSNLNPSMYKVYTPKQLRELREAGREISKIYSDSE